MKGRSSKVEKAMDASLKKKAREISIKEGCAYSVSEGTGIRYIAPYALALNASNMQISFLSSLPSLAGTFSQLFALKAMHKFSRKSLAFWGAFLQAIMWLPILGLGIFYSFFNVNSGALPALLVLLYTILMAVGNYFIPAWASWMKDIVPDHRGSYFGRRTRLCSFVFIVASLLGGLILDYFKKTNVFWGFAILFSIAFIARAISAFLFRKKYEPKFVQQDGYYFSLWEFIKKMPFNNFGHFTIFYAVMYLAVMISSPFFAVYQLKDLGFSYSQFIIIGIIPTVASMVFLPLWGKFADYYGNRKIMQICGALIPLVPILWLFTIFFPHRYASFVWPYLLLAESFSGLAWAGFNLSTSNFIYDAVSRERMAICVAYFNIATSVATFIGATLGGILSSTSLHLFGLSTLLSVFLISGIARFAAYFAMIRKVHEVKAVPKFGVKEAMENFYHLTPQRFIQLFRVKPS